LLSLATASLLNIAFRCHAIEPLRLRHFLPSFLRARRASQITFFGCIAS
jgi:hypothetical protein